MGSGCSLGTDILDNVCTPEDIDKKIKNYFQNTKHKRNKKRNRFLIKNYSDDENNDYENNDYENNDYENNDYEEIDEEENNDYEEIDEHENNEYENNDIYKYNNSSYNNNLRYKKKYIKKFINPLSKTHINKKAFNLEPLSLDIVSNYKKINRRLNNKNCELRLTKLLLQGKEDECENLKKSINCIATNSIKY